MISLQATTGAKNMVFDVKGAYLKSEIKDWKKEELFIRMPDGRIYTLNKHLYGLKQSGAEWETNATTVLKIMITRHVSILTEKYLSKVMIRPMNR